MNNIDAGYAPREVLAIAIDGEEYGIDIGRIQEIRGYDAVTRIANAPGFIKGVINLRGVILPIVDLRVILGVAAPVYDALTVVVVLSIGGQTLGLVVDSVSDVITLAPEQIKPPPGATGALAIDYIVGVGTVDERMLILVDIARLMSSHHMLALDTALAA
ncbi:chemotaxis protein CheW [Massilia sp. GCM10020059]|uniref:Chemotaxis protein CheW n=1 Tax=Massilia agrisoli TaxID=2892444 RepID=A0ABS8ITV5_9BURK|nr:chemotaxis protein CheW [Massilia agrisoli]MCC6071984.1 chemotaxis protein CheW [Massilia agrisoli]